MTTLSSVTKADKVIIIKQEESIDSVKEKLKTICTETYLNSIVELPDGKGGKYKTTRFERTWGFVTRNKDTLIGKVDWILMGNRHYSGDDFSTCPRYPLSFNITETPDDIVVAISYCTQ